MKFSSYLRRMREHILADDPIASGATCAWLTSFIPECIPHMAKTAKFLGNGSMDLIDQLVQPLTAANPPFRVVPEYQDLNAR